MTLDSGQATVIACFVKLQRLNCYPTSQQFLLSAGNKVF